ncbi:VWA domain-containing protein [Candidatus Lokiarchaeum ossiferum]|uniref:VWA domain-containing protein n=1 Tax=Candidatus Lokiarchaeum ossiferum TaxID=2951803 RepID=UPI00352D4543
MSSKIPYVNILQSAICIPAAEEIPIALDIKILPDKNIPPEAFFGVWLLDISGSMAGDRLDNAKESLIEQVKILPENTMFNLITFESEIHEILTNVKITNSSRSDIIKRIDKIQDRGTTSLFEALEKGVGLIREYVRNGGNLSVKKIILISDGDPTDVQVKSGDESDPNYQKYFQLAKEALEYKSSIDTVGALGEHNVYLMYEIAKQSAGKYIFAENEDELKTKMIIATEQTAKIAFSQPTMQLTGILGKIDLEDAAQYKPTVIRMPFNKVNDQLANATFRSFEAGDTYQILVKGKLYLDKSKINMEVPNKILGLEIDFGKPEMKIQQDIMIKFSTDPSKFKLNQDINKKYANVFSQAEEIADCTIRGDAQATQRIQGDETKKIG